MSKKRILLLTLLSILIITGVSMLVFGYMRRNNNDDQVVEETDKQEGIQNEENLADESKEIDYEIEYANIENKNKNFKVKLKSFEDQVNNEGVKYEAVFVNDKLSIPEEELLTISRYIDLEKITVLDNESFVVHYGEDVEGMLHGYYLVHNNGEKYYDLDDISTFGRIVDVKIEGNKFTIRRSKRESFLDITCMEVDYDDNAVIDIEQEFEYLGNGNFGEIKIIKDITMKDLLIESGEHQSCSEYVYN